MEQTASNFWSRWKKTVWNKTFLLVLIPFSSALGAAFGEFTVRMIGRSLGYEKCLQDFCHASPKIVHIKDDEAPMMT